MGHFRTAVLFHANLLQILTAILNKYIYIYIIYVDIDIISDTALPAGIVVCRPSTHTGCVLKLRVGVKSCVQPILEEDSSIPMLAVPYWYMDEEYGELGQPLCSESLLREHSLTTTSSQIEKKLQKHQKKRNHFTSLSKCIAGKLEELHDKKKVK